MLPVKLMLTRIKISDPVLPNPEKCIRPCTKRPNHLRCSTINNSGNGSVSLSIIQSFCFGCLWQPWRILLFGNLEGITTNNICSEVILNNIDIKYWSGQGFISFSLKMNCSRRYYAHEMCNIGNTCMRQTRTRQLR